MAELTKISITDPETGRVGKVLPENLLTVLNYGYELHNAPERVAIKDPDTGRTGTVASRDLRTVLNDNNKYQLANTQEFQQKQYTFGNRVKSAASSLGSGVAGGFVDMSTMIPNLGISAINSKINSNAHDAYNELSQEGGEDSVLPNMPGGIGGDFLSVRPPPGNTPEEQISPPQIPLIPSLTDTTKEVMDSATGTETPPDQKSVNQGLEFMGTILSGGALAKVAKELGKAGLAKLGNLVGSTSKSQLAGAGATGYTMSELEDSGVGVPGSLAGSLGAGIATTAALKGGKNIWKNGFNIPTKAKISAAGLGKDNLNLEAAKNARELGIDLPTTAFSDTKRATYGDYAGGKLNQALPDKYAKAEEQTKKVLEDIYDKTGRAKTPDVQRELSKLYEDRVKDLPDGARVKPTNTEEAVKKIDLDIKDSISLSDDEKKVIKILEDYKKEFNTKASIGGTEIKGVELPLQDALVKRLARSKKSLNNQIKWDVDEGIKDQLRSVQKALSKDIEVYGNANPEWYKTFKKADEEFAKVATREKLEKQISQKAIDPKSDKLSYEMLSKAIGDEKTKNILKKNPESLEKLQKLRTVAKAMSSKNSKTPNTKEAVATGMAVSFVASVLSNPVAALTSSTAVTALGLNRYAKLLTDGKLLDAAIKLAEKPTEKSAVAFSRRMKSITGYTPVTLAKQQSNKEQERQEKGGKGLRAKINNHFEKNKKRKPGQGLKKLLSNPTVGKIGRALNDNPWKRN